MLRKKIMPTICATILAGTFSTNVSATIELAEASGGMMAGQMLQVFFALAITLATIWGLSKIVVKKNWIKGSEKQRIKILDSVAIGTRDRIMLIEVDNQNIVVATTPGRIQSLHTFENAHPAKTTEQTFKSVLDSSKNVPSVSEASQ